MKENASFDLSITPLQNTEGGETCYITQYSIKIKPVLNTELWLFIINSSIQNDNMHNKFLIKPTLEEWKLIFRKSM